MLTPSICACSYRIQVCRKHSSLPSRDACQMSASRNLLKHMLARALTCCDVSCMRHNCLEQLMLMRETVQEADTTARTLSTVYMKGSRSATS